MCEVYVHSLKMWLANSKWDNYKSRVKFPPNAGYYTILGSVVYNNNIKLTSFTIIILLIHVCK